jgi:hypothetical protein
VGPAVGIAAADCGAAEREGGPDNVADRDGFTPPDELHDDRNIAAAASAAKAPSNTDREIDRHD